jgi:hypothetical protein
MNVRKSLGLSFVLFCSFAFILPAARADEADQATFLTFSRPVRIPGTVLSPGSYWFVLWGGRNISQVVEIFNADRTKVIQMLLAVPSERTKPTGNTVLTFAEPRGENSKRPDALVTWFYPGDLEGHQFIYSPRREKRVDHDEHVTMNVTESAVPPRRISSS